MKRLIKRILILQGRITYPDACVAIKGYVRCVNPAKERYLERLRRGSFIIVAAIFVAQRFCRFDVLSQMWGAFVSATTLVFDTLEKNDFSHTDHAPVWW